MSRKALKVSLSSKLFSVFGTSEERHSNHSQIAQARGSQHHQSLVARLLAPRLALHQDYAAHIVLHSVLTDLGEPPGNAAVNLIQKNDDHKVDDDSRGCDRNPDVGPH